jgi:hypothetical protein
MCINTLHKEIVMMMMMIIIIIIIQPVVTRMIETCTVFQTASYNEKSLHCYSSISGPKLSAAGVLPAFRIRTSAILLLERTGS